MMAVIRHGHGLGETLGLVVDAPDANRVHVSPVALGLGTHLRVAVALRRAGQQ